MKFSWNNEWQRSLTQEERQKFANKSRAHLACKASGSHPHYRITLKQINEFERGRICLDISDISTCNLDLSDNANWNVFIEDVIVD